LKQFIVKNKKNWGLASIFCLPLKAQNFCKQKLKIIVKTKAKTEEVKYQI
jgi:hypothetical protein